MRCNECKKCSCDGNCKDNTCPAGIIVSRSAASSKSAVFITYPITI